MKKLNEKEMSKVSGGSNIMSRYEIESHQGNFVDKYDAVEGNLYVIKNGTFIFIGRLIRSYEKEQLYGNTVRWHEFDIITQGENPANPSSFLGVRELCGDNTSLFEYIE